MHLTYHDPDQYSSEASPAKGGGAGAPESSYGDFMEGLPSGDLIQADVTDPLRELLECAYHEWAGENYYALDAGLSGDVLDLRERLNAAFANAPSSSLVAPIAE
jgi:hypothetical protein